MLTLIKNPTVIESVGNKPKRIEEYVERINSASEALSIAKMVSAGGWEEPGQAVIAPAGQWVRYSTPEDGGAEYVAICLPAFSPTTVHRDS